MSTEHDWFDYFVMGFIIPIIVIFLFFVAAIVICRVMP